MESPAKRESLRAGKACPRKGRPAEERKRVAKSLERLPGKAAIARHGPVPQTDTGGWGENPKADGRSTAKELGKMAP